MTTDEKDLLIRALGSGEPPLRLDFDALEARGQARRRTRGLLGATAAVFAIGGTALVVGTHSAADTAVPGSLLAPTEREIGYCYGTADIGSTAPNQHVALGLGGRDGFVDLTGDITRLCADSWQSNVYDFQPRRPGATTYRVPQLVACVLTSKAVAATEGAVGVFPGDGHTCAELGLPTAWLR